MMLVFGFTITRVISLLQSSESFGTSKNRDLMVNSNLGLKSHVEVQNFFNRLCLGGPVFPLVQMIPSRSMNSSSDVELLLCS